ncbi:hypothetical protein JCM21714_2499 [Gracilibacillus boraciitolerans JCM 21714]|uniref:Uncharacterized protein n=1 Tax=Gracilibacillus boraciitolerans JCM 21714 TaxID=1298598 RepID=W4VKZ2_9BACI|nr:hypothetical protein [Gracilibacillus boraciitolerans]GAE93419.1 hypothetical protein JCM21714_2499 [Gracilibacillus boraciitolerans JCM 21714]
MQFSELVKSINHYTEHLDLVTARKYIEENLDLLNQKKHLLSHNARGILEFMIKRREAGYRNLDKRELATIRAVNKYAEEFDVRGIKLIVREKPNLFIEKEAIEYLSNDSKVILIGMGVLKKEA